jgi:flavorubredoxin
MEEPTMDDTRIDEFADGMYRISTWTDPPGMVFNQILIDADEPLLFHLGHRGAFDTVSAAVTRVVPLDKLRWLSFGHYEADECGSMNRWLAAAPRSEVTHGLTGVLVSLGDTADRAPRALADGEVLDLGGRRVRWIETPHVPHGWDAGLMYEEVTGTLLAGDLFTQMGPSDPVSSDADVLDRAVAAEDLLGATALTPRTAPTIRALADLEPNRLALMHGPVYEGDGGELLRALADDYEARLTDA